MSYKSWADEFYPIPAGVIKEDASDEELIQHSLNKWKGLLPENLEKHDGTLKTSSLSDVSHASFLECRINLTANTCSLCTKYYDRDCEGCPLERQGDKCGQRNSPYIKATIYGNVPPMVTALEKALSKIKESNDE